MTTIVYKNGVIAYDSRITRGDTILDDDYNKNKIFNGVNFFLAGQSHLMDSMIDMYFGGKLVELSSSPTMIVLDNNKLFLVGYSDNEIWKFRVSLKNHIAIGSGSDHALTAMDMGSTAIEAVEMANKRDICTGGTIRFFKCN